MSNCSGGCGEAEPDTPCSLLRGFNVGERKQLRFRGEFFNLLNHPDFGLPARTFEGRGFGTVTTAYPARRVQVGLTLSY